MHLRASGTNITTQLAERINGEHGLTQRQRIASEDMRDPLLPGKVGRKSLLALLERQGYRCALTGEPLEPETSALDHIIPVSRDGSHGIGNVQILVRDVNAAKGTMTNDEFVALCRRVVAYQDETGG